MRNLIMAKVIPRKIAESRIIKSIYLFTLDIIDSVFAIDSATCASM